MDTNVLLQLVVTAAHPSSEKGVSKEMKIGKLTAKEIAQKIISDH